MLALKINSQLNLLTARHRICETAEDFDFSGGDYEHEGLDTEISASFLNSVAELYLNSVACKSVIGRHIVYGGYFAHILVPSRNGGIVVRGLLSRMLVACFVGRSSYRSPH